MITATLNGQPLELPRNFSFEHVQTSQLFNFDKLRGDYVPNISFPDVETNRALLNHPNRFELRRGGIKEYPNFELRCDGFRLAGTLVLTNQLSGYVRGVVGTLSATQEERLITDATLATAVVFDNKESFDPATDNYCAPLLYNPDFFSNIGVTADIDDAEITILQAQHGNLNYAVNHREAGLVLVTTDVLQCQKGGVLKIPPYNVNVVTPMLYLFNAIELLMKANGFFKLESDFDTDTELSRLVVYNNNTINDVNLVVSEVKKQIILPWSGGINTAANITNYTQQLRSFTYAELLPPITLKQFLLSAQNLINFATVLSGNRYFIVDREKLLESTSVNIDQYFTGIWLLGEKNNSVLKFNMSHDTNDFYFVTYYQDLSSREDDFIPDVETKEVLDAIVPEKIGALCRVLAEQKVYEYNTGTAIDENCDDTEMVGWRFASIDFQFYRYNLGDNNTGTVEINTEASTAPYSGTAQVRQPGRFALRKDTEAGFTLRLLFDENNVAKNNSTNYMLNYRYANNLIQKRWPITNRFISNLQTVEGYFHFPAGMLASISNTPYAANNFNRTKFRTRQGEFLIQKLITRFSHAGIGETKAEVWKV